MVDCARKKEGRLRSPDSLIGRKGRELTALAMTGEIVFPFERERESAEVLSALCRMEKGNPLLLGEAGVGTSAVAEGAACLLASGDAPHFLRSASLVEIRVSSFLEAKRYGDGEDFVSSLCKEVLEDNKDGLKTILFVDDFDALCMDDDKRGWGAWLKPFLGHVNFRMIAAMTQKVFRRCMLKDDMLLRFFSPVFIGEFGPDQAVRALRGKGALLEAFHGVIIPFDTAEAAVELSQRYLPQRRLPEKALDILDIACVLAKSGGEVTREHVRAAVARSANLPPEAVACSFAEVCGGLEERLAERVKGQPSALKKVCRLLKRRTAGFGRRRDRPLGSFLFFGPTGTGKTELAKALAEAFFGSERHIVRLDMTEYSDDASVSRLIGSNPGYIDSERGGLLTEAVRKKPYSLFLFDEIEKAAPSVVRLFLQILDEGRLGDAFGESFDFRNVLMVFTTNAGSRSYKGTIGFFPGEEAVERERETAEQELQHAFPREFLGRFDELVQFEELSEETLREIFATLIAGESGQLSERGVFLEVADDALDLLSRTVAGTSYGGREVHRVLSAQLMDPLSDLILSGARGVFKVEVGSAGRGEIALRLASERMERAESRDRRMRGAKREGSE